MNIKDKIVPALGIAIGLAGTRHAEMAHDLYSNPAVADFIMGYQHDITAPIGAYFGLTLVLRVMKSVEEKSILYKGILTFCVCAGGEIAQGVGLYYGTFDPKDFLAYATGVALAMGADKLTSKNEVKTNTIDDKF
jgi:hypothetical protein